MSRARHFFLASIFLYAAALPVSMAATNFALALILLSVLMLLVLKSERPDFSPSIYWLLLFFLWAALTQMMAEGSWNFKRFDSFSKVWNVLLYLLIPCGANFLKDKTLKALKILVVTGSIVVILGAIEYWSGINYFFEGWFHGRPLVFEDRFYGFQSHPLHTGGFYMILFLSALGVVMFQAVNLKEQFFWYGTAAILGLGTLLTVSRSYFLGMILGALILSFVKGWKTTLTVIVIGICSVIIVSAVSPLFRQRLKTINWNHTDKSGEQRVYLWKSALLMIRDHPVTGVGYHQWRNNLPNYAGRFRELEIEEALLGHAHNSYLTVGAETGLVGLFLFLSFWFLLLREQFQFLLSSPKGSLSFTLTLSSIAIIFSLMLGGCFEHNLMTASVSLALFFVIGLSRAESRLQTS